MNNGQKTVVLSFNDLVILRYIWVSSQLQFTVNHTFIHTYTYLQAETVNTDRKFASLFMLFVTGEMWERAKSLQEKMQANLVMARDRLDVLGELYCGVYDVFNDLFIYSTNRNSITCDELPLNSYKNMANPKVRITINFDSG